MIIDASAMMAILQHEPERLLFLQKIAADGVRCMSTAGYMECSMLLFSRKGRLGLQEFDALVKRLRIEFIGTDTEQARLSREAFIRFGKGHHPAKLNLGDCFAYALAKQMGEPLLFKGNDFDRTDLVAA